jgi:hypothetical protein
VKNASRKLHKESKEKKSDFLGVGPILITLHLGNGRGHHDHMVVGFITTYAISAYHH